MVPCLSQFLQSLHLPSHSPQSLPEQPGKANTSTVKKGREGGRGDEGGEGDEGGREMREGGR